MKNTFFKRIVSISTIIMCFSTITAFAASSFTYDGYGIRGKRSVGRLTASTGISVKHTNSNWNVPNSSSQIMEVWADREVWWGWSTESKYSTSGSGTTYFDFSSLPSGTYSLYFHAPSNPASANINGSASGY